MIYEIKGTTQRLKGSHLGIPKRFVSSCKRGFDRLGGRLDLARPSSLTQPSARMFQPVMVMGNRYHASDLVYSLAEVKFTFLEAV